MPSGRVPEISANVGLSSFMALSDGHLQKMADSLKILAQEDGVRTREWEKIRGPLRQVANLKVEAVNWFASPNGNLWVRTPLNRTCYVRSRTSDYSRASVLK